MSSSKNLGPYELRGELGRGAMAKVWRAWDSKLHRDVAIKEPHFDERLTQDALAELGTRFVREGVAAARLNHPGIVTIYAADIYDGRPVIVMELVEGMTLGEMLQAGALAPQVALDVLDQLLDAVAYAHSQGVVHRDIKPDNIFVSKDGRVKLSDFGIARLEDAAHTKATQIGTVLGTPGYMAPEQATGSDVDSRTDLFAIGTIAYEMLTGNNPFGAGESTNAASLLYKIVHEPEAELPIDVSAGLPSDIRPAIHTALNKSPDERPQNAAGFKAMLRGAPLETRHSTASPPDASKTQQASVKPAPSSSKRALPVLVASAGVALLVWLVITASPGQSGGSVPRSQESSSAPSVSLLQHNDTINKPELIPANVSVGNTLNLGEVSFAAYHGGNFLHAIEWQVLAVEDNRVLMISKDIIDLRPYHGQLKSITWEHSDLRKWLNGLFYHGLPVEVRTQIQEQTNQNPDTSGTPGGRATQDKVFVLSIDEAELYLSSSSSRQAGVVITDASLRHSKDVWGIDIEASISQHGGYSWWLRSPGSSGSEGAAGVRGDGVFVFGNINNESYGIRPAMWLSRESTTHTDNEQPNSSSSNAQANNEQPSSNTGSTQTNTSSPGSSTSQGSAAIYRNARFGYSLMVPSGFVMSEEASNGDGLLMTNESLKMEIVVYGANNVFNETTRERYEATLVGREGWYNSCSERSYVVTYLENGNVHYILECVGEGSINHISLAYPESRKSVNDAILEAIIESYTPGDLTVAH